MIDTIDTNMCLFLKRSVATESLLTDNYFALGLMHYRRCHFVQPFAITIWHAALLLRTPPFKRKTTSIGSDRYANSLSNGVFRIDLTRKITARMCVYRYNR